MQLTTGKLKLFQPFRVFSSGDRQTLDHDFGGFHELYNILFTLPLLIATRLLYSFYKTGMYLHFLKHSVGLLSF